ncbi:hypothetical protein RhiirA5_500459 [Rhizophagus irregularis]|uniref:Uncharacterized protein n=3 Tax=Rhizophagus irregularis TaxID=588596 RepID=A0A2I1F4A4_9GLOM|nr:hypothetical protein GLOIN_2v1839571 [Rhizophagus irregularis DAOM 181602=DAOM 197198]EXX61950.1 hypothetical protein RirG_166370 [Rhizophagus irregularis DAOM 197198w]PKC07751.1 hypothetical protein RhiirA5_500459 [Rhizophagus irregularis]PKC64092.1 hypothetical protein RhiirA1_443007 [Rhizophagus irregularis]PKY29186.1 hypothetical protein RhiirB3_530333 [Rhizophagus irregularis]POG74024.1 hypothetical protein GLOIN_2v1839571 [Rhizophagus irregularis DAOM 181602=DAOM 197198]|eukprot:XP_025180890.1 hypothetical protein GLOIN_2v1839571 [Rhizophagus irregularis DAOM 181602=DAOM 197198]
MRVFTLILILTLTLGFLTTAESTYAIPKIFKDILVFQNDWDVIGPFMERQIPQYVQGAESFTQLKQLYGKALQAFSSGKNYAWRFKNLGLTDAIKTFDATNIELAVFKNIEKLSSNAVYSLADKIANALRYGVKVGGKPVEVTIEMIASEMGVAAQVEGASAIESAIIGISEEEAVSALVACIIVAE